MRKFIILVLLYLSVISQINAHPGIGIVIDDLGNVYFTDLEHVWKINPAGKVSIAIENVHTHQLLLDEKGILHGEHVWHIENGELWAHYLWQMNASGEFRRTTGNINEFPINNYLVKDLKGNSYYPENVNERKVLIKESPDGLKDPATNELFSDIRWLQYSISRNSILVVDYTTVKEVNSEGEVSLLGKEFGTNSLAFTNVSDRHKIMGVWTDNAGNVYISLYGLQKVVVINKNGNVKDAVNVSGLWSPTGGVYDKEGNLWLLEYSARNKARVRKFTPDGVVEKYYPGK